MRPFRELILPVEKFQFCTKLMGLNEIYIYKKKFNLTNSSFISFSINRVEIYSNAISYHFKFNMGTSQSSETQETIESDGQVNNNVIVQETVNIYSFEIVLLLGIIATLKLIEFIYFVYRALHNKTKKKYLRNNVNRIIV